MEREARNKTPYCSICAGIGKLCLNSGSWDIWGWEFPLGHGQRCWYPRRTAQYEEHNRKKGRQCSGKVGPKETLRDQVYGGRAWPPSVAQGLQGLQGTASSASPGAMWPCLPWLTGPAVGLGVFARAQCQANGAMWLLEQGWSSAGHWPGLARLPWLLTAPQLPHLCWCIPSCAAVSSASCEGSTGSEQIKELHYSKAASTDHIPELPACSTPFAISPGGGRARLFDPGRAGNAGSSAAGPCQFISGNGFSHCFSIVYTDLFRVYLHIYYTCSSHQCWVDLILHWLGCAGRYAKHC